MDGQGQILMPPDYRHGGIKNHQPVFELMTLWLKANTIHCTILVAILFSRVKPFQQFWKRVVQGTFL